MIFIIALALLVYLALRFRRSVGQFWLTWIAPLAERVDAAARKAADAPETVHPHKLSPLNEKDAQEIRK